MTLAALPALSGCPKRLPLDRPAIKPATSPMMTQARQTATRRQGKEALGLGLGLAVDDTSFLRFRLLFGAVFMLDGLVTTHVCQDYTPAQSSNHLNNPRECGRARGHRREIAKGADDYEGEYPPGPKCNPESMSLPPFFSHGPSVQGPRGPR